MGSTRWISWPRLQSSPGRTFPKPAHPTRGSRRLRIDDLQIVDLDTPAEVLFNNHAEWEYKSNFLVFRSFGPLAGPARLPGIGGGRELTVRHPCGRKPSPRHKG